MFLELIATFMAGFAGAGIVMLLNKILGGRLPRWFVPVAAGAAMLAATITNEYSWFPRTRSSLPDGMIITETVENRAMYRPWTYAYPYVERFVAIDTESQKTHPDHAGLVLVDVYYFGRWAPVHKLPVMADCARNKRAALTDGISFGDDGSVAGASWVTATESDPILSALCGAV